MLWRMPVGALWQSLTRYRINLRTIIRAMYPDQGPAHVDGKNLDYSIMDIGGAAALAAGTSVE
jgi:hypothetical protein